MRRLNIFLILLILFLSCSSKIDEQIESVNKKKADYFKARNELSSEIVKIFESNKNSSDMHKEFLYDAYYL